MPVTKLKTVSAVEALSNAISEDIYRMNYLPGQQITENELSNRYGISRNTVREAIAGLLSSGLLVKLINKGVYVKQITEDDVREIFYFRELLETEAVRMIIRGGVIPASLVLAMERVEDNLKLESDWYDFVGADLDFHYELVEAANSPRLLRLYDAIYSEIMLCLCQSKETLRANPKNMFEHRRFIDTMEKGDEEEAITLVRNHIRFGIDNVARGFQRAEA